MVSGIDGYGKGIGPLKTTPIKPLKSGDAPSPISPLITPEEKEAISSSVTRNFGFLGGKEKEDAEAMLATEIAFRKNEEEGKALGLV